MTSGGLSLYWEGPPSVVAAATTDGAGCDGGAAGVAAKGTAGAGRDGGAAGAAA